ncbi:MAG: helix-turn-helix transcriptional regulator [Clostridia bacterium]|nr:helix-turn-helix transcriptional regulator [Clostridia bacterium]
MIWNKRIKELREDRDLTQSQLAEILGTTQRTVSYYENNQREIPVNVLVKYAKYFNVTLDYICGLE